MLQLTVDKEQTLKTFTENNYAQASFFWNTLLKNKDIKVNGKKIGKDVPVQKGDVITYYLSPKQQEKSAFSILYQDENFCIVDKQSGVNSEAVFSALQRERECYFIHRLDRNTKGLLAFALNATAEKELLCAFKEKRVEKRYHALCFGSIKEDGGIKTAYLKKDADKANVRIYDNQVAGAEKIITEYHVLQRDKNFTKVEVILHTGKTHQIRAHLAHLGHPIVGDMKYGDSDKNKEQNLSRQCLVAKCLQFTLSGSFSYINERQWISRFQAEKGDENL